MAYSFSTTVKIDHYKCGSSNVSNFPLYFTTTQTYLKDVGHSGQVQNPSGFVDIAFFSDNGLTTPLNFERISWDGTAGTFTAWIQIPTLSASSDTTFYMAWGNASQASDPQAATSTWDSNYKAVWHMNDSAASTTVLDSTSNARSMTLAANTSTKSVTGQLGNALTFVRASSDFATIGSSVALSTGAFTLEAWAYLRDTNANNFWNNDGLFAAATNGTGPNTNFFGGKYRTYSGSADGVIDSTAIGTGSWVKLDIVRDSGGVQTLYHNGLPSSPTNTNAFSFTVAYIGRGASGNYLWGDLDELRISNTNRSADYFLASYNNQRLASAGTGNAADPFYVVGGSFPAIRIVSSTEVGPTASGGTSWSYTTVGAQDGDVIVVSQFQTNFSAAGAAVPTFTTSNSDTVTTLAAQGAGSAGSCLLSVKYYKQTNTAGVGQRTLTGTVDGTTNNTVTGMVTIWRGADATSPIGTSRNNSGDTIANVSSQSITPGISPGASDMTVGVMGVLSVTPGWNLTGTGTWFKGNEVNSNKQVGTRKVNVAEFNQAIGSAGSIAAQTLAMSAPQTGRFAFFTLTPTLAGSTIGVPVSPSTAMPNPTIGLDTFTTGGIDYTLAQPGVRVGINLTAPTIHLSHTLTATADLGKVSGVAILQDSAGSPATTLTATGTLGGVTASAHITASHNLVATTTFGRLTATASPLVSHVLTAATSFGRLTATANLGLTQHNLHAAANLGRITGAGTINVNRTGVTIDTASDLRLGWTFLLSDRSTGE